MNQDQYPNSPNRITKKVSVVGAGFSGLLTSYYLLKKGVGVEIFESQARPGGLIQTVETEYGKVETAANGLLNSEELEALCRDIGVELMSTRDEARKRFIVRDGVASRWPLKIFETIRLALVLADKFDGVVILPVLTIGD